MISKGIQFLYQHKTLSLLIFLCPIAFIAFFLKLGSFPIVQWDEARQAVSAYEMGRNHNYLVTYFDGYPDMWSTKPPLFIWLVTLSFELFGYTKVALRLPSALIGLSTALLIFYYCKKHLQDIKIGFFAVLVLMTSWGYIGYHVTRTADYDALLTLFTTLYLLYFYRFLHFRDKKAYILFGAGVILAFFTKNIAGLIMLSGMGIYTISTKKLPLILKSKETYYVLISFIILVALFLVLREKQNPGFVKAMLENDVTGRFIKGKMGHEEIFEFYFDNLLSYRYSYWIFFLPFCVLLALKSAKYGQFSLYLLVALLVDFFVLSSSKVKCDWYDAPFFPIMAVLIGIGLNEVFQELIVKNIAPLSGKKIGLFVCFVLVLFSLPTKFIVKAINDPGPQSLNQIQYGDFMTNLDNELPNWKSYQVLNIDYNAHLVFYRNVLNEKGNKIRITDGNLYVPKTGDTVLTCRAECLALINACYTYKIIKEKNDCKFYLLEQMSYEKISQLVNATIDQIKTNSDWLSDIRIKAQTRKIDLGLQLKYDAIYVLKSQKKMNDETEAFYFKESSEL
jgi:4-amino-4-deoxy-L-arabinose transferase-like glycosyltransferase